MVYTFKSEKERLEFLRSGVKAVEIEPISVEQDTKEVEKKPKDKPKKKKAVKKDDK